MNIEQTKVRLNNRCYERYRFDGMYDTQSECDGLIICYLLSESTLADMKLFYAEAENSEIGVINSWTSEYSAQEFHQNFSTLDEFLEKYNCEDFGFWQITALYDLKEVKFTGGKDSRMVSVSFSAESSVKILPVLMEAEDASYKYNPFDKDIVSTVMDKLGLSTKRTVASLTKLSEYPQIYEEFTAVISTGKFLPADKAVSEQGYTAEALYKNNELSILGAYNYIIYLKEKPEKAIEDLRKGLKKK